ncbi:MAG: hypothetical protein ACI35W_00230 [Anaeroplasmataceae bacterium]
MKNDYIRPISLFIAIIFHNYIIFKYYFMKNIYQVYGHMSYLFIIFVIVFSFLVSLSLNNSKVNNITNLVKRKWYIKYTLVLYLIISNIIVGTMSIRILQNNFFSSYKILPFIITLFITVFFISNIKAVGSINILTIPASIYFIFFIITNIVNIDIKDFSLLLPFEMIDIPPINLIIASILLVIDNYIFYFLGSDFNKPFKASKVFLANLIWLSMVLIELINMTVLAGESFLYDYPYIGFLSYSVQQTFKYIGNFDFIYIYLITMFSTFKLTLNNTIMKSLISNKHSIVSFILIILAVYYMLNNFEWFNNNINLMIIIIFVLFLPYFISLYIGDKIEKY